MVLETEEMPMQEAPTVANSDIVSLQITLPQLLDLALGSPEVGAVNFNILHNFLHVLLHQTNLQSTKIEYRGEEADHIKTMVTSLKPKAVLHEYSVTNGVGKITQRVEEDDDVTVDVLTEDTQSPEGEDLKMARGVLQQIGAEIENDAQTVVYVEPIVNGVPPTTLAFKELEQSVKQLQQQGIANEQGIDKLTTMIQDVMKSDTGGPVEDVSSINARLDTLEDKVSKMEQQLTGLQSITNILTEDVLSADDNHIDVGMKASEEIAATDEEIVPSDEKEEETEISKKFDKTSKKIAEKLAARRISPDGPVITEIRQDVATLKIDVAQIQRELQDLTKSEKIAQGEIETIVHVPSVQEQPVVSEKIEDIELVSEIKDVTNLEECVEAMRNVEAKHNKILRNVTQRVATLETEINVLSEKLDTVQGIGRIDDADVNELVAKIQGIETDMDKIEQTMDKLFDDKEQRETHINMVLEQIEILKTVKADKEDIEDALADKADAQVVNRKVSHDRFDAACDTLTHGLEEAIDKLTKQESIWQQALDEVQNEIAGKMDKTEIMPLKDFVNNKLKSLQEKLKIIEEARREIEAAGTKKLLRDVQCISCDKDVVMKREEVGRFHAAAFPCTTSIKPYLTYKLDQIRKQQRKLPCRNMIQYEAAIQEEVKKMRAREEIPVKIPKGHLVNRYCGGSHTTTTPQQRVTRMDHFLTQWGPKMIQLTDGWIKGKNDQMYRGRLTPSKEVCGPSYWDSQISVKTRNSLSQERGSSNSSVRKSLPSHRNNVGNQNRNSKRSSKEMKISEPAEKPIVETSQMAISAPQENDKRPLAIPPPSQDEFMLYDTKEVTEEEIE